MGQTWRREPEIGEQRKNYLAERCRVEPDLEQGIYPFRAIEPRLTRADIEWLIASRVSSAMPADRLDLRGADLQGLNLAGLPLMDILGCLTEEEWHSITDESRKKSVLQMNRANIRQANFNMALLDRVRFDGADLGNASLVGASVYKAHFEDADLFRAHCEGANLRGAHFEGADLHEVYLEAADLRVAVLSGGSRLNGAHLQGAALDQMIVDNANLTVIDWAAVRRLGDEVEARQRRRAGVDPSGKTTRRRKRALTRVAEYRAASRAYRMLSLALRSQGIAAASARFHFRSEVMERRAAFHDMRAAFTWKRIWLTPVYALSWLTSLALSAFTGYGDKLWRLALTYSILVVGFATLFYFSGNQGLSWELIRDLLVLSVSSFHGRGLLPPALHLTDTMAALAGLEALFGLLVEALFIAAVIRRVTGN
jgi:uncharacterized protein YjbI with pentapeptide repeats